MLRDSVVVVVVRTRPRAIPLAMITMRKSTHGFPSLSSTCLSMGLGYYGGVITWCKFECDGCLGGGEGRGGGRAGAGDSWLGYGLGRPVGCSSALGM